MKILVIIIAAVAIAVIVSVSFFSTSFFSMAFAQTNQYSPYPHGIGSNSSALYNSVGLSYQQCQDKIGNELQKSVDSLDRGKAVSLALSSSDFQSKVAGHKYALGIISTNDTWDNAVCGNIKRTAVGVGFNFLDTPDTYDESIEVAEDGNFTKITQVGTTITPTCHDNCPPAPPAFGMNFQPDIISEFYTYDHMVPNVTIPVSIDLANVGNSTLYDVHVAFVDSPLLLDFKTQYGNFTLQTGQEKTIMGTISSPSIISNVTSILNWMVYAKNQDDATGSKEFSKLINLVNMSTLENSLPYTEISSPLKQFDSGNPVNEISCKDRLQLIIKTENHSPACVTSMTAQKLIERRWAESLESLLATPIQINIVGLQQNYKVGQPIIATVKYTGYLSSNSFPDVKILDANGTQVWSNCCIAMGGISHFVYGTFTYDVQGPKTVNGIVESGSPVINTIGTYTMIASLDNKTAEAKFVVSP